ncbi:MAG: hypothetical protein A2Z14_17045 [Chloroflexi bacterium RBG_16_48_8]|nr:MAG: hypothetical protein A2Z14_17045 [Chloroflexi bacterium RBG_16_48_8]
MIDLKDNQSSFLVDSAVATSLPICLYEVNEMSRLVSRIRSPVRREGGETYLLLTLLSFGASVGLTRLFLEVTGYPQLGGASLHIAHVLWGGLFLFMAALLPLIFANRWVYILGSILAGLGVGLFIDEVGKFITQSNDYFYSAAAPIVYAFFLLTVLVYLQTRRPEKRSARVELYRALDALSEVLDRDLDLQEREDLESRLRFVEKTGEAEGLAKLARELLDFLNSDAVFVISDKPTFLERIEKRFLIFENRWITRARFRAILAGGLLALGVAAVINYARLLIGTQVPETLEKWLTVWFEVGRVTDVRGLLWLLTRVGLEGIVGFLLFLAAIQFIIGKDRWGQAIAYFSLLLSLTVTNLLVFYFEQFSTIIPALVQFLLLLGVLRYKHRFLSKVLDRRME